MNDNLLDLVNKVKEQIDNEPIVQEFFRLKKIVENDAEIASFTEKMHYHERQMTLNMNNNEIYFKEKEEFEKYKSLLDNNPILVDYNNVCEEVYNLLLEVKTILS